MSNLWGFPFSGKMSDSDDSIDLSNKAFTTVSNRGSKKVGLDVVPIGNYRVTEDAVILTGSDNHTVKITAHGAKIGDIIRLKTTVNTFDETEFTIKSITNANEFELDALASVNFSTGDTVDLLRPISPRLDSSGATLSTITAPPIQFYKDDVATYVKKDTVTPANNIPLPVELIGVNGTLEVTAQNLNIQSTHAGANPDSMQIGDGTETVAVSTSNELQTKDSSAIALLTTIDADTSSLNGCVGGTELQVDIVAALPVGTNLIGNVKISDGTETANINASNELQVDDDAGNALLTTIDADTSSLAGCVGGTELQVDIVGISTIATEVTLGLIKDAVQIIDNIVAGSEAQVDIVAALPIGDNNIGNVDIASEIPAGTQLIGNVKISDGTETANINASNELQVADDTARTSLASIAAAVDGLDVIDFMDTNPVLDASSANIPASASAPLILVASFAAAVKKIQIFETTGNFLMFYNDASGANLEFICGPGTNETVEVSLAASSALYVRNAANTAITVGKLAMNFMG